MAAGECVMVESRFRPWIRLVNLIVIFALVGGLLSACGSVNVEETYPLESVSRNGDQTSYVYRAEGETVPEVAKALAEKKKPEQMSEEDPDHMFLVYSDQLIHVQKDPEHAEDTLIEVDSTEYVRQNYSPSFLEGYLLASVIGSLFDSVGRSGGYGDYRGYGSKTYYPPASGSYRAPTASDTKDAPPITVQKKGSIIKRSSSADTGGVGSGGLFGKKSGSSSSSGSKGSIIRNDESDKSGSKKSSGWLKPRKSGVPKTRVGGFGRIKRR
jgi:hypothetical protein